MFWCLEKTLSSSAKYQWKHAERQSAFSEVLVYYDKKYCSIHHCVLPKNVMQEFIYETAEQGKQSMKDG